MSKIVRKVRLRIDAGAAKPGPAIGKRRREPKAPSIPAWCPLTLGAWHAGPDSAQYQHQLRSSTSSASSRPPNG